MAKTTKKTTKLLRYFPHDGVFRCDKRMLRLRMKHGRTGCDIFWDILERLCLTDDQTMETDYELLDYQMQDGVDVLKAEPRDLFERRAQIPPQSS